MKHLDVFTARNLRNNAGGLIRDAEKGQISIITKYGHPVALTIPFDNRLLEQGVHRTLAVSLFENNLATLSQAAKIADLSIEDFLDVLREFDVVVVDYPGEELEREIEGLQ